jgi:Fe-S oxidoreductase
VDETVRMISGCMLCGKCTMVCPRGIKTRHLILTVNRLYKKEEEI